MSSPTTPASSRIWDDDHRAAVDKIIKRLVMSAKQPAIVRHSVASCRYGWGMSLQDECDFRALLRLSKKGMLATTEDCMFVLSEMIDRSVDAVDQFENVYRELREDVERVRKTRHQWEFVLPLFVRCAPNVELPISYRVLGQDVAISAWKTAISGLPTALLNRALAQSQNQRSRPRPMYCLALSSNSWSQNAAWGAVEPAFDAFRGMLEFMFGFMTKRFSAPPAPVRHIPHPPWMLAWRSDDLEKIEAVDFQVDEADKDPHHPVELDDQVLEKLASNLHNCIDDSGDKRETKSLIADALRLYVQAIDAPRPHLYFLGIWQLAEALTLVEDHQGSGKKLCTRLTEVVRRFTKKLDTSNLQAVLLGLFEKRNRLVHNGIHNTIEQSDGNFLKTFCEVVLLWIVENAKELPTKHHVEQFYQLSLVNNTEFSATKDTIQFLDKMSNSQSVPKK